MVPRISTIREEEHLPNALSDFGYGMEYSVRNIVPSCIQRLYQLNNLTAPYNIGTMIGISSYLSQTANVELLRSFIAMCAHISSRSS